MTDNTNQLLTSQISSLERELTELRGNLSGVTIERDALEFELQQLHDRVQTLEIQVEDYQHHEEQHQKQQQLQRHASGKHLHNNKDHPAVSVTGGDTPKTPGITTTTTTNRPSSSGSKKPPIVSITTSSPSDQTLGGGSGNTDEDDVNKRAQQTFLAIQSKKLTQKIDAQKAAFRSVLTLTKKFSQDFKKDVAYLRDTFEDSSKECYDCLKKDLKKTLIPTMEQLIEIERQKMVTALTTHQLHQQQERMFSATSSNVGVITSQQGSSSLTVSSVGSRQQQYNQNGSVNTQNQSLTPNPANPNQQQNSSQSSTHQHLSAASSTKQQQRHGSSVRFQEDLHEAGSSFNSQRQLSGIPTATSQSPSGDFSNSLNPSDQKQQQQHDTDENDNNMANNMCMMSENEDGSLIELHDFQNGDPSVGKEVSDPSSQKSGTTVSSHTSSSIQRREYSQGLKQYGERPSHGVLLTPEHSLASFPKNLSNNSSNSDGSHYQTGNNNNNRHNRNNNNSSQFRGSNDNSTNGDGFTEGITRSSDDPNFQSTATALPHPEGTDSIAQDDSSHHYHNYRRYDSSIYEEATKRAYARADSLASNAFGALSSANSNLRGVNSNVGNNMGNSLSDTFEPGGGDSLSNSASRHPFASNNNNASSNRGDRGSNRFGQSVRSDFDDEDDDDFIYNPGKYAKRRGSKVRIRRNREPSVIHVEGGDSSFSDDDEDDETIRANRKASVQSRQSEMSEQNRINSQSHLQNKMSNATNISTQSSNETKRANNSRLRRRGHENEGRPIAHSDSDYDDEFGNSNTNNNEDRPFYLTHAQMKTYQNRIKALEETEIQFVEFEKAIRRLLLTIGRDGEADSSEWDRKFELIAIKAAKEKEKEENEQAKETNNNSNDQDEENNNNNTTDESDNNNNNKNSLVSLLKPETVKKNEKRRKLLDAKLRHATESCNTAARCFTVCHLHPQLRSLCADRVDRAFSMLDSEIRLLWDMMEEERSFAGGTRPRRYSQIAADHGFANHGEVTVDAEGNTVYNKSGTGGATTATAASDTKTEEAIRLGQKCPPLHRVLKLLGEVKGCSDAAEELTSRFRALSYKFSQKTFSFLRRLRYIGAAAVPPVVHKINRRNNNIRNSNMTTFSGPPSFSTNTNIPDRSNTSNTSNNALMSIVMSDDSFNDSEVAATTILDLVDTDAPVLGFCTSCKTPLRCTDCAQSKIFSSISDQQQQQQDALLKKYSLTTNTSWTEEQKRLQIDAIRGSVASVFRRYAIERMRNILIQRAEERTEHAIALAGIVEQAKVVLMMQRRGTLPVLPGKALENPNELASSILIRRKELPHSSAEQHFTRARVAIMERERTLKREVIAAVNVKSVRAALDVAMKKAASGLAMVNGNSSMSGINSNDNNNLAMSASTTHQMNASTMNRNGLTAASSAINAQSLIQEEVAEFMASAIDHPNMMKSMNNNQSELRDSSIPKPVIYDAMNKPSPATLMKEAQKSWMPHLMMMNPVPPSALLSGNNINNNKNSFGMKNITNNNSPTNTPRNLSRNVSNASSVRKSMLTARNSTLTQASKNSK